MDVGRQRRGDGLGTFVWVVKINRQRSFRKRFTVFYNSFFYINMGLYYVGCRVLMRVRKTQLLKILKFFKIQVFLDTEEVKPKGFGPYQGSSCLQILVSCLLLHYVK